MKKFISVLLFICVIFAACDNDKDTDNNNNNNTETISINSLSIKNAGIKSIYVSNIPVNNSGRAASGSTITTLSYINNLGQNAPFFFVSPSGKNIVLGVSEVQQLDEKRIVVDFTSFYEITENDNTFTIGETINTSYINTSGRITSARALIDMESKKVYDFKDYTNIQFVSNDLLFSLENETLYKVDLNNISVAVPLNNPAYVPLKNSYFPVIINKKYLGNGYQPYTGVYNEPSPYSIDINNEYTPMVIKDAYIASNECSFLNNHKVDFYSLYSNNLVILDLGKNVWYFVRQNDKYFIGKISIDNMGNVSVTDYVEGDLSFDAGSVTMATGIPQPFIINSASNGKIGSKTMLNKSSLIQTNLEYFYNSGLVMVYDNGFIAFKKKAFGIVIESVAVSLPSVNRYNSFIKDNYFYYVSGTSICRIYLDSGSSPETIYTNQRLYVGGNNEDAILASGSNLIFYQYGDDNVSVNTYSLAMYQQGATPKLLATSSIDVRNIIELDF